MYRHGKMTARWQDGRRAAEQRPATSNRQRRASQMDATVTPTRGLQPPITRPPTASPIRPAGEEVLCVPHSTSVCTPALEVFPRFGPGPCACMPIYVGCWTVTGRLPPLPLAPARRTVPGLRSRRGLDSRPMRGSRFPGGCGARREPLASRRAALKGGSVCFPPPNGVRRQQTERQENSAEKGRLHHLGYLT